MDIPETDFEEFLCLLLDDEQIEDVAAGITKQVISRGVDSLSSKQKYVFQREVLDEFASQECERCSADIPWSEKYAAGVIIRQEKATNLTPKKPSQLDKRGKKWPKQRIPNKNPKLPKSHLFWHRARNENSGRIHHLSPQ